MAKKPIGIIHSNDMKRTVVVYLEKSGWFTVADRAENGNESKFETCFTMWDAAKTSEDRIKAYNDTLYRESVAASATP